MPRPRLFHVSEEAGIARFEPRPSPSPEDTDIQGDVVWAIAESHLVNFLTPRDCPRITFRAGAETTPADLALLQGADCVVAFEAAWLARVNACRLHIYEMPREPFAEVLPQAGYWVSREAVTPIGVEVRGGLIQALGAAGAEVRILQDFWPLCDAVAGSSLEFSILRKRNALPRRA